MAIFGDSDIPTMLTDWNNLLTAGAVTVPCALEDRDVEVLAQEGAAPQIVRRTMATIQKTALPDLAANDPVTVDGVDYIVWERLDVGDGGTSDLWLRRIDAGS